MADCRRISAQASGMISAAALPIAIQAPLVGLKRATT
jgi:hypothetical protein